MILHYIPTTKISKYNDNKNVQFSIKAFAKLYFKYY